LPEVARAGANAAAHAKLNWGATFNTTQTDLSTPDGASTPATLWVSAVGLTQFAGADVQIIVNSDQAYWTGAALPSAWQFQDNEPSPCANNIDNLSVSPGTAFGGLTYATSQAHMIYGNQSVGFQISHLWILWYSAASGSAAA